MPITLRTIFRTIFRSLNSKPFKIAACLVLFYLVFSYFAVDPLAKRLLPWVAEQKLASRMQVEHVRFDPLRLILTIDNLSLTRKTGEPLAGFKRLYINMEASGLLRFAWRIKDIWLVAPEALVDIAPDGKLNWAELIAKLNENQEESSTMPRVLIDHILIERGDIQYSERNRATPFQASLEPLGLELEGLSTLPEDRGDYQIVAKLPEQGGTLKWKGDIGLNPIVSSGTVALDGVRIAKLMQAIPSLPLQISSGELSTALTYNFAMVKGTDEPKPEIAIRNLALTLDDVNGSLNGKTSSEFRLVQLEMKLPQLTFSMRKGTQLQLKGMAINLKKAALHMADTPLLELPHAQVSGIEFDLASNDMKVDEVTLSEGNLQATRLADGSVNWQHLIGSVDTDSKQANSNTADQDEKGINLTIGNVRLEHWQAAYQDRTFKQPLALSIRDINTSFALAHNGLDTTLTALQAQLGPFGLASLQPANSTQATASSIQASSTSQPSASSSAHNAATLAKLNLQGGEISLKQHKIKMDSLLLSGLQAQVVRNADKTLNWLALLEPAYATAIKPAVNATKTSPWVLALGSIQLENGAVHFEDKTTANPVMLDLQDAALKLENASLDLAKALPLHASFKVKQGGQFNMSGKLTPAPLQADLDMKLAALSLKPFAPYINQFALLRLNDGSANLQGKVTVKTAKVTSTQLNGGFSVNSLAISEESGGAPFLGWKSLSSDSLKVALNPDQLHMDELRIDQPLGKVIIFEDKSINIQRIMRPQAVHAQSQSQTQAQAQTQTQAQTAGSKTKASGEAASDNFPMAVERIKINNGELEFADLSLKPQFGTYINTLTGSINGISTNPATTAQVELDGKVDEYGSARIRGSLQPFRATEFTDLKLAFHNLEMSRLTPYSGKFAGRRIESGKMSVDLEYNIKKRQLAGTNKFVLNKLRLGEHVDSPDAVNLPLDLAIALLEDSDGIIDLDLPVAGSLDDPQFSYGKVVWKAFVNVLGKIVTSPFRALGNLLGMSSDKLEGVMFDAGTADIAPPEQEKLKKLSEALAKRPSLTLTIVPAYNPVEDTKAIQQAVIRKDVAETMGLKILPNEKPGPINVNNPKVQSAISELSRERSPEAKNRKLLEKFKDYVTASKPTDPAAYEAMLQQLQQWVSVSDDQLKSLANARAAAMQQQLESAGMAGRSTINAAEATNNAGGNTVLVKMVLSVAKK